MRSWNDDMVTIAEALGLDISHEAPDDVVPVIVESIRDIMYRNNRLEELASLCERWLLENG